MKKDKYSEARCPCKNEPVDECTCEHCKINPAEEKRLRDWLRKEFEK